MSEQQAQQLTSKAQEFAEAVIRNDGTPTYAYSEARLSDGEEPAAGERWATPAELARDFLKTLAARVAGCPDEGQREPTAAMIQAAAIVLWEKGNERLGLERDREVIGEYVDEAEAALRAARVGAVAASPDERQVDPVIPSSGAAESRGGWRTGPVCDARLQKGN